MDQQRLIILLNLLKTSIVNVKSLNEVVFHQHFDNESL